MQVILALLIAASLPAIKPTAAWTYTCTIGARVCQFTADSTKHDPGVRIVDYLWNWDVAGTNKSEHHTGPTATNTFPAGGWIVRLTITDAAGNSSYSTQFLTVPYSMPGIKHDTVTVYATKYDTVRVLVPGPIRYDTTIIRLPVIHDTTIVQLPATPPNGTGRKIVVTAQQEIIVYDGPVFLGRLFEMVPGRWQAYHAMPNSMSMPCLGLVSVGTCNGYSSQQAAADALPSPIVTSAP